MSASATYSSFTPPTGERPRGSAWRVYGRLLGYALRYKTRLLASLLFALIIAISFGGILITLGSVIKITFYEPPAVEEAAVQNDEEATDPALEIATEITGYSEKMRDVVGWAPEGLDQRFLAFVDRMRADKMAALRIACGLVLILALVVGVARYLQEYLAGSVGANIIATLECEMYDNVIRQSVGFFEERGTGDILARFTNDIFMINRGLAEIFAKLFREPFKAVAFFLVALHVDPVLAITGTCVLPPILFVLIRIGKKMRKTTRRSLQKIASLVSAVGESVNGIVIVKGYGMESYAVGRVHEEVGRLRRYLLRTVKLHAITGPVTDFLLLLGIVFFVLLSGHYVVEGRLELVDLAQLYFALAMMLDPVRKLSLVNNMVQISVASAERVFDYLDVKPNIVESANPVELPPLKKSIRFDRVGFSYDGKTEVLHDFDLEISKGEMVALVGFSGAGKSTVVKLIPRFYDVSRGAITIDGVDIREASFKSLRDQISIVTQDTILFATRVRDNITCGREDYGEDQVRDAARMAHADEFVRKLPEGYDTVLSEDGGSLSGGQRQRLAIARAIVRDSAILILDEATSSLDSESERYIQEALEKFVAGRTAIVIAHRLSTIQRADRIVVLEDGRIAEQGTHEELLRSGGLYQRLFQAQFAKS